MKKFSAILLLSCGGVPLLVALIVLLGNMGDTWTLHLIFFDFTVSRSLMLILTAIFVPVIYKLARYFIPRGIKALAGQSEAAAGSSDDKNTPESL